jgi:hypothetical protein
MYERDRRASEKSYEVAVHLQRCMPGSPPHQDLRLMVTATQTGTILFNLSPISSITGPPAVLEATLTTPWYLHAPTHAVAEHETYKESENETK